MVPASHVSPRACHVSPNSPVHWSWPRANWIHGRVWCEILLDRSEGYALERIENTFSSPSQGGLMRAEHENKETVRNARQEITETPRLNIFQHISASGATCWGIVLETSGKCVVAAATGGFRGFGEPRPVSISGSSWQNTSAISPCRLGCELCWIMLKSVAVWYVLIDLPPTTFTIWSCGANLSTRLVLLALRVNSTITAAQASKLSVK